MKQHSDSSGHVSSSGSLHTDPDSEIVDYQRKRTRQSVEIPKPSLELEGISPIAGGDTKFDINGKIYIDN